MVKAARLAVVIQFGFAWTKRLRALKTGGLHKIKKDPLRGDASEYFQSGPMLPRIRAAVRIVTPIFRESPAVSLRGGPIPLGNAGPNGGSRRRCHFI
jgi:hypothetical protein